MSANFMALPDDLLRLVAHGEGITVEFKEYSKNIP